MHLAGLDACSVPMANLISGRDAGGLLFSLLRGRFDHKRDFCLQVGVAPPEVRGQLEIEVS